MEFQITIKRTQIAKLTFSVPDGDTEAAEERASALFRHAQIHPKDVFAECSAEYDYALASVDPAGPVIFEFDK